MALADLVAEINAFFAAARSGAEVEENGRAAWRDNTMKLGKALLAGRELHQNDSNAFHAWLETNGLGDDLISKDERFSLIGMAEHPEVTERVLATTARRSWREIWRLEIAPEIERPRGGSQPENPPAKSKPNRGGRPRGSNAPAQSAGPHAAVAQAPHSALPIEDAVEHELLAKCSSPRPVWQRPDKMASIINRPVAVVKEALVRLHEKGLAEGHKGPEGIWFEYWVPDKSERKATDSLDADIRIIELEDENAELKRENVELKRQNAELKAQLGERDDEIARLRPRLGVTRPSSSTDEQLERFESGEAESAALSKETVH
jgi:hypothetical protein